MDPEIARMQRRLDALEAEIMVLNERFTNLVEAKKVLTQVLMNLVADQGQRK